MRVSTAPDQGNLATLLNHPAGKMMNQPAISLCADATIPEALALFLDRGYHAAPVIDEAGRPIGVVSMSDLLRHDLDRGTHPSHGERLHGHAVPEGFEVEEVDTALVCDIMTEAVFTVHLDTPLRSLVQKMLELDVHQLYVVDNEMVLVGVMSTIDVVRALNDWSHAE
ncbi:MAG: CBS domain-containing protein [Gemmataceae bacterium]|nr:CBS domain-containing protein [Gemmataceae bacterium]